MNQGNEPLTEENDDENGIVVVKTSSTHHDPCECPEERDRRSVTLHGVDTQQILCPSKHLDVMVL